MTRVVVALCMVGIVCSGCESLTQPSSNRRNTLALTSFTPASGAVLSLGQLASFTLSYEAAEDGMSLSGGFYDTAGGAMSTFGGPVSVLGAAGTTTLDLRLVSAGTTTTVRFFLISQGSVVTTFSVPWQGQWQ